MAPLTIDLQGVTSDLLRSDDNPALKRIISEAINPTPQIGDGAGFDNRPPGVDV
jgi:hypothetical protein